MSDSQNPYVFLHIGKTAGTSLRQALIRHFPKDSVCPLVFHGQIAALSDEEKSRYQLFSAHIGFDMARSLCGDEPHIFTMLRDPVDRVLSLYYYWREVDGERGGPVLAKELPLDEFLESRKASVVVDVHNTQTWQLAFSHVGPSRRSIGKQFSEDAIYERALSNLQVLDVIGVQENMEHFRRSLNNTYGWQLPEFPRLNRTGGKQPRQQLPMATRRRIQELTAMDQELYSHVLKHHVLSDS